MASLKYEIFPLTVKPSITKKVLLLSVVAHVITSLLGQGEKGALYRLCKQLLKEWDSEDVLQLTCLHGF